MRQLADVSIVEFNNNEEFGNYNFFKTKRLFCKQLYGFSPDLVHIFGCWSFSAFLTMKWAKRRGFIVVYSPYGALHHLNRNDKGFWKKYLPQWFLYQKRMTASANYLTARDKTEQDTLSKHVKKTKLFFIDRTQSDYNIMQSLLSTYTTIADENVFHYMNQREKNAFRLLLRNGTDRTLALCSPSTNYAKRFPGVTLTDEDMSLLRKLKKEEIERIRLLAKHMSLRLIIDVALRELLHYNFSSSEIAQLNTPGDPTESIKKLHYAIKKKENIFNELVNVYIAIKYNDYDERKIVTKLGKLNLRRFTRRVESILSFLLFLEPGYMPMPKSSRYQSHRLYKKIISTLSQ